jgi:hypothetical protein
LIRHSIKITAAIGLLALTACGPDEPASSGGPPAVRRMTEAQYRQTIADIFGPDIKVTGRFEPGMRSSGLLAVGAGRVTVTPSGFEQYEAMGRSIAAQALDEKHRDRLMPCKPASAKAPDDACAALFLGKVGRLLFHRPLLNDEMQEQVSVANKAAQTLGDFYSGLQFGLAGLLAAPEFVFREEEFEPDPAHPGQFRLTAYSKAQRLSFPLWNTAPDDVLLTAAARGDLDTRKGLAKQADRLLASPRLKDGVRAFFSDMLGFDAFDDLAKDSVIYPKFSLKVANDAKEQSLLTITDLLITRHGDYRDLFTTRKTFLSRPLGIVYRLPVAARTGFEPHEFPENDPRAGLLSQISFLALHSHPGRSSPTLRGKAVRELILCEPVPAPPANVNFSIVQDTNNPRFKTARERLTAHRTNPTCAGCHKIIDPIGLGLEAFDGAGQYRPNENGVPIDTSGEIDGIAFNDAASLGKALHDDPATPACLVTDIYRYAAGHDPAPGEKDWLAYLRQQFAADGYRLPELLRRIAVSDDFYKVSPPRGTGEPVMEATR